MAPHPPGVAFISVRVVAAYHDPCDDKPGITGTSLHRLVYYACFVSAISWIIRIVWHTCQLHQVLSTGEQSIVVNKSYMWIISNLCLSPIVTSIFGMPMWLIFSSGASIAANLFYSTAWNTECMAIPVCCLTVTFAIAQILVFDSRRIFVEEVSCLFHRIRICVYPYSIYCICIYFIYEMVYHGFVFVDIILYMVN